MKVAIVGLSPTRVHAPWGDPEWELWGLGLDPRVHELNRVLEIHDIRLMRTYPDWEIYRKRLLELDWFYAQQATKELPNGRPFPLEIEHTDYMCSSLSYCMALAMHEGAKEIALWGIDMRDEDGYGYQRPNMEYMIGLARGKGIKVHVPAQSHLLRFQCDPDVNYAGRYGWMG